jgi:hypothetical protein
MGSNSRRVGSLCALLGIMASLAVAGGTASADDFYKGRQVSIIVGFGPGGGYDAYARLLARHIGNHIPGRPSVVVQNMDGAGSVRASNYVYVNAAKDGTVIAASNQNMPMFSILGAKAAQFDAGRMQWIGSIVGSNGLLYTWHKSETRTLADARKRETPLGGTGTNSDSHIFPTVINKLLGTKFKVINGYAGGSKEIHIALERGEVEGRGGNSWASLYASNPDWVDQKKLNFLVQIGLRPDPASQLAGVPVLVDLIADPDDKRAVEVITLPTVLGYAYWLAPEVSGERIGELRTAFQATMKDEAFLADAVKSKMLVKPQPGEDVAALVTRAAATPKAVLERTSALLEWKN